MRRLTARCLVVLVLALSVIGRAGAEPVPLQRYAPADAFLVVHSAGLEGADTLLKDTALGGIIHHDDIQALVGPFWKKLEQAIDKQEQGKAFFSRLVMQPMTFSMRNTRRNEGLPLDWLLAVDVGPEGSQMRKRVDRFIEHARQQLPPEVVFSTEQFRGTLITDVPLGEFTFSYCYWQNKFLAGSSSMVVREQLSGDRRDISAHPAYKKLNVRRDDSAPIISAFIDLEAFGKQVERTGDREGKKFFAFEMVRSIKALQVTMTPAGKDVRTRVTAVLPKDSPLGGFVEAKPLSPDLVKMVPADARMFYAMRFKPARVVDLLESAVEQLGDPGDIREFRKGLDDFRRDTGLDLRRDVLGWDDGQCMVVLRRQPMLAVLPQVAVVVKVADADKLRRVEQSLVMAISMELANERIMGRQGAMLAMQETTWKGHTLRYLKAAGVPMPLSPAWTMRDGWMIAAPSLPGLKGYLLQLDQGKSIDTLPQFKALSGRMMTLPASIGYGDAGAGFRRFYGLGTGALTAAASVIEKQTGVVVDLSRLPAAEELAGALGPCGWCTWRDDDVVGLEIVSPLVVPLFDPGSLDVMSAVGVGGASMPVVAGVGAAMLLPVLARAREASRSASSMLQLRQILLAARMYADAHRNRFPEDLDTLVETNYLDDPRVLVSPHFEGPGHGYRLVKGVRASDDPSWIIVYEARPIRGKRLVGRNGGDCLQIPEHVFQAQLKKQQEKLKDRQ